MNKLSFSDLVSQVLGGEDANEGSDVLDFMETAGAVQAVEHLNIFVGMLPTGVGAGTNLAEVVGQAHVDAMLRVVPQFEQPKAAESLHQIHDDFAQMDEETQQLLFQALLVLLAGFLDSNVKDWKKQTPEQRVVVHVLYVALTVLRDSSGQKPTGARKDVVRGVLASPPFIMMLLPVLFIALMFSGLGKFDDHPETITVQRDFGLLTQEQISDMTMRTTFRALDEAGFSPIDSLAVLVSRQTEPGGLPVVSHSMVIGEPQYYGEEMRQTVRGTVTLMSPTAFLFEVQIPRMLATPLPLVGSMIAELTSAKPPRQPAEGLSLEAAEALNILTHQPGALTLLRRYMQGVFAGITKPFRWVVILNALIMMTYAGWSTYKRVRQLEYANALISGTLRKLVGKQGNQNRREKKDLGDNDINEWAERIRRELSK